MARQIVLLFILIILSYANAQEIPYKFSKDIIAQIEKKTKYFCLSVSNYRFAFKGDYIILIGRKN